MKNKNSILFYFSGVLNLQGCKCSKNDIFHHLFCVIIGSLVVFTFNNGKFVALSHFFLCGLPGAIDYIYLFLYQCDYITKITRLNMATFLNVWIRGPGLCMLSTFAILKFIYIKKTLYDLIELVLQVIMTYGNGQYYLKDVVFTNNLKILNRK